MYELAEFPREVERPVTGIRFIQEGYKQYVLIASCTYLCLTNTHFCSTK